MTTSFPYGASAEAVRGNTDYTVVLFTQCHQTPLDISEERVGFVPCRDNHSAAFTTDKCSI
jgi:hypothetical protein